MSKTIDPRRHNSAEPLFVPRWKHHATHKSVLVESQEELDRLGEGWSDKILQDHPNGYMKGHKPHVAPKISGKAEHEGSEDSGSGEEMDESGATDDGRGSEKSNKELRETLMSQGIPAKELKGKSREELIALIEA